MLAEAVGAIPADCRGTSRARSRRQQHFLCSDGKLRSISDDDFRPSSVGLDQARSTRLFMRELGQVPEFGRVRAPNHNNEVRVGVGGIKIQEGGLATAPPGGHNLGNWSANGRGFAHMHRSLA